MRTNVTLLGGFKARLSHALSLAREHRERGHEAWAVRLLGEIDSHSDPPDRDAAKINYHRALGQADELGMRPLAARCHLGLGTLYREMGDQPQSERHLTTAMGLFHEIEMEPWLVQVKQLLRQPRPPEDTAFRRRAGTPYSAS